MQSKKLPVGINMLRNGVNTYVTILYGKVIRACIVYYGLLMRPSCHLEWPQHMQKPGHVIGLVSGGVNPRVAVL